MLYIGIDIGKSTHQVVILNHAGQPTGKSFSIKNRREGMAYLMERISHANPNAEGLHFGLEATGHYWLALYCALADIGHQITVLNPMQSAAYRKLQIRPVKTDRVDAHCIAEMIRVLPPDTLPVMDARYYSLRQLTRLRNELTEQKSDVKRRTLGILDRVFPELDGLFIHPLCKTGRAILREYGTPAGIIAADREAFIQFAYQHSGGKVKREKAEAILAAAHNSFSARLGQDIAHFQLKLYLDQMDTLEAQLEVINAKIEAYLTQIPQTLTTIPGISSNLAATLLAEIGDIRRFDNAQALVAYAGVDPRVFQSGQFTAKQVHISKRGSPNLRLALWQAATGAARFDPALKALHQRKLAAGKPFQVAMGAVVNKLVHIIYALLRDQKPYQPMLPI